MVGRGKINETTNPTRQCQSALSHFIQAFNFTECNVCTAVTCTMASHIETRSSVVVIHHSLNETIGSGVMGGSPDHRVMLLFYLDGWITLTLLNFQLDFK